MGITEVKDTTDGYTLVNKLGIYTSEKDETHSYYGFSVKFDRPVRLRENKEYKLKSSITGPVSWYGTEGQTFVECQGVVFTFLTSRDNISETSVTAGQLPVLFWSASG